MLLAFRFVEVVLAFLVAVVFVDFFAAVVPAVVLDLAVVFDSPGVLFVARFFATALGFAAVVADLAVRLVFVLPVVVVSALSTVDFARDVVLLAAAVLVCPLADFVAA